MSARCLLQYFFFNHPATPEIYTLSLHDALPISPAGRDSTRTTCCPGSAPVSERTRWRSEEHTCELQSPVRLVCRLLLEKKTPPHQSLPLRKKKTQRRPQPGHVLHP